MRYYRILRGESPVLVVESDNEYYDLTATERPVQSFGELARTARTVDQSLDELSRDLCAEAPTVAPEAVIENALMPVSPDEVWGAGVTYPISQEARESEGGVPDMYRNAYESERPEVYFKATPSRTVGPNEAIGIRGDSNWDVPEPELSIILLDGEIVGYTIGNDVCSWELEWENVLYLPQSKTYKRCCAIGPCVSTVDDPHSLTMQMSVVRDGRTVLEESTSTSEMIRTCEELVSYFKRHNEIPEMTVFLTGTSLMAPDDFTLREGDTVNIEIEEIGTLTNEVVVV